MIRNWRAAGGGSDKRNSEKRSNRDNANELLIGVVCVVMSETCAVTPCSLVRYTALLEEHVL